MSKNCKHCTLFNNEGNFCTLFKIFIDRPEDYCCPKYTKELTTCVCCGRDFIPPGILYYQSPNQLLVICQECYSLKGSCATCKKTRQCEFETNTTCPEQKIVMATTQQGNMTIQTQIKNPKRVELLCQNCDCYDKEMNQCLKEIGFCPKYIMRGVNEY